MMPCPVCRTMCASNNRRYIKSGVAYKRSYKCPEHGPFTTDETYTKIKRKVGKPKDTPEVMKRTILALRQRIFRMTKRTPR